MTRRLAVRIYVAANATEADVRRTRSSVQRSARAVRRAGYVLDIEIVLPGSAAPGVHHSSPDSLIATCAAGTVLDARFLPSAARTLADGHAATILADHLLIASEGLVARRVPDSRRSAFGLATVLEQNVWPGPRVTTSAVDQRAGSPGPGWSGVLALIRTGTPMITVPAINTIPDDLSTHRDRLDAASVRQIAAGLQTIAPREAAGPSEWEMRHPVASGPIRVARRGGRGLWRRAREVAERAGDRRAQRRAQRALYASFAPDPEHRDDPLSPRRDGEYGRLLSDTWDALSRVADAVVVTAQVSTRSSDQAALHYTRALTADDDHAPVVKLITTADPGRTESGLIPLEVQHLPLSASFDDLTAAQRGEFLIELSALCDATLLAVIDDPSVEDPVRQATTTASPLVTTQSTTLATPGRRLDGSIATLIVNGPEQARAAISGGMRADLVAVRSFRPLPTLPSFATVTQYTAAHDDVDFDLDHPFRLLWRTSDEDAPERDAELAEFIQMLAARSLPVVVHVHHEIGRTGPTVERRDVTDLLRDEGQFTGGALSLPTEDYHALILDRGMRDARAFCLQAMLLGLPIVARHHIADIAVDGVTAVVAPDASMAGLVDVVEGLLSSRDRRRVLIRTAYDATCELLAQSEPTAEGVDRELRRASQ